MIKNVLSNIDGVGVYGVISICIFFGFFSGVLLWAGLRKKSYLNQMSALPLNSGERETQSKDKIKG